MNLTDKLLADLRSEQESDPLFLDEIITEFYRECSYLAADDMNRVETELLTSQYAYVKFGFVLEKVRNQCMWKRCAQKFADFRQFCQQKVNLTIWQANNAIESANVALKLVSLGFTELPRNASQALALAKLSIERLGEVWEQIIQNHEPHKITADIIKYAIDPDKEPSSSTIRLPKHVIDALTERAISCGMTLGEYLAELAAVGEDDDEVSPQEVKFEVNPEMAAIIDRVEYQWLKPISENFLETVDRSVDAFDRLMDNLIGQFIPPVRHAIE
jgi:hypothetical protein